MIELHCHSTLSDGKLSPKEIIDKAKKLGLTLLSITDHSYILNDPFIEEYAKEQGIELLKGIELNCEYMSNFHILGYGIKNTSFLNILCQKLEQENEKVCLRLVKRLKTHGFDINASELTKNENGVITKQTIKQFLVDKGYFVSTFEVYRYLRKNNLDISLCDYDAKFVIDTIHLCGGIAVLAHPNTIKSKKTKEILSNEGLDMLLASLKELGLDGVEVKNLKSNSEKSKLLQSLADNYGLIKTVGSDFHDESHALGYEENVEWLAKFKDAISKRNQEYDESKVIELAMQLDIKKLLKKKPNLVEKYTKII